MLKFIKKYKDYLVFSFFSLSIMCWLLEMLYSVIFRFKFVLPGAWFGPYCPIYGLSFVLLLLFINKKNSFVLNFVKIFLLVSIVEYIISYISSEVFNNVIWDYSNDFLNINGRICLEMSLSFTLLGVFYVYVIDPILRRFYIKSSDKFRFLNRFLIIIFCVDILVKLIIS